MSTRKEIRDSVLDRTRETGINTIIDNLINTTLGEIQAPGWAYAPRREHHHLWNFNRRKTTLATVEDQEDYELPRDLDKIGLIRQTQSSAMLKRVPDEIFYRLLPNPTTTGNPLFYRMWEEVGTSVDLEEADKIDVISSSTSDTSSFTVSIVGYINGYKDSEVLTLNGTTIVNGSKTWDAGRPLRITKSGTTTGKITVTENSGSTTLLVLGPEERGARFKIVSFYPIPSSEITINIEYFTRIRFLRNDSDEPDFDEKWHWVVEQGTMAKVYEYKQAESLQRFAQSVYSAGVRSMIEADSTQWDYIPRMRSAAEDRHGVGIIALSDNQVDSGGFGVFS